MTTTDITSTATTTAKAAATTAAAPVYAPRLERQDETLILDILKTSRLIGQVWPVSRTDKSPPRYMLLMDRGVMTGELNAALAARKADFEVTEQQLRDLLAKTCITTAELGKLIKAAGGRTTLGSRWAAPRGKEQGAATATGRLVEEAGPAP